MHKLFIYFIIFLLVNSSYGQNTLNLDFENVTSKDKILKTWHTYGKGYKISLDSIDNFSGNYSLLIHNQNEISGSFASCTGELNDTLLRNKSVIFSGWIKTENVTNGYAGLWWRVADKDNNGIQFENMHDKGIVGTNEWIKVSIEMEINSQMSTIHFGGLLTGTGKAWFDNFELTIDEESYQEEKGLIDENLSNEQIDYFKSIIYPIKTVDPKDNTWEDLFILSNLFSDSKYIGLGEVTHGASEIFLLKHRIIKYLFEKENFNMFLIEANMPKAYDLNNSIIQNSDTNTNAYIRNLGFWTWSTNEMKDFILWMQDYNFQKPDSLLFAGFDMQNYKSSIDVLRKNINQLEIIRKIDDLDSLLNNKDANRKIVVKDIDVQNLINEIELLISKDLNPEQRNWNMKFIDILKQSLNLNLENRDMYMYENIKWILERNPFSKGIIWAHNSHVKHTHTSMGKYLKNYYKKDYLSIGFLFYEGSYTAYGENGIEKYTAQEAYPGTYEYYFNSLSEPIFALDLRKIEKNSNTEWLFKDLELRQTGAIKTMNEFQRSNLTEEFDIIIFINQVHNSSLLND